MTRKAAWCGLPFLLGDVLYCAFGGSFWLLAVGTAVLCALSLLAMPKFRAYAAAVGISVLCGLTVGKAYALLCIDPALELDGKYVTAEGEVTDQRNAGSERWLVTVSGNADGRKASVNFYTDREFEAYEKVRISGTVSAITDSPEFDSESYWFPKGVFLEGTADTIETDGELGSPILRGITALRDFSARCITASMDGESAAFAQAILCGDRSELSQVSKTKLYRSGIGHLFALSGTHLTIIAAIFSAMLGIFIHSKRVKLIALEGVILLFVAFGGFSPSLVRAGIMTSLVFCSSFAGRRTDVLNSLGICAVLMCGANPLVCTTPSFICSFTACYALGAVAPKLTEPLKKHRLAFLTVPAVDTAVILAVMMPAMALMFDEVSIIAVITQPLLVPICTAALALCPMALILGGTTLPARIIFRFADLLIKLLLRLSDFFASLSFASIGSRHTAALLIASAVLITALVTAILRKKVGIFALSALGTFIMLWAWQSAVQVFERGDVRVKIFSNGRKSCAVLIHGGSAEVIDIGAKGSYSYGVQEYLSRNGITRCGNAFIADDLGAYSYKTEIYPAFETLRTEYGYYSEPFEAGMSAEIGELVVTRTEDGYRVSANGKMLTLTKGEAELTGKGKITREAMRAGAEIELK
ncbi:MAG: ComEC/Rec2 family competence protein [Ruminococcus sp.]|nr:ComEC/Rec2 family competence protein [Ruminococcus sp.]